jgi:hypothetical protein
MILGTDTKDTQRKMNTAGSAVVVLTISEMNTNGRSGIQKNEAGLSLEEKPLRCHVSAQDFRPRIE